MSENIKKVAKVNWSNTEDHEAQAPNSWKGSGSESQSDKDSRESHEFSKNETTPAHENEMIQPWNDANPNFIDESYSPSEK